MPKKRIPIPDEIASEVLFRSDRTCCVCRERGKHIQIHHLDEDPSNWDTANLAVLCLDCHTMTQTKGGFDRKLDSNQILTYRNDWHERIRTRRDMADVIASAKSLGETKFDLLMRIYFSHKELDRT